MIRARFAIAVLVLVPTVVFAQGGKKGKMGAGDQETDWKGIEKTANAGMQLSNKDVENASPIKLLMDKRKDLKLSDDVLKQLRDIDAKDKETNKNLFKTLDSLRGEAKANSTVAADDASRIRAQMAISAASTVVASIRTNYASSVAAAMPLLDDSQKSAANDLLQKQTKDVDEMLKQKLNDRAAGEGANSGPPPSGRRGGRG